MEVLNLHNSTESSVTRRNVAAQVTCLSDAYRRQNRTPGLRHGKVRGQMKGTAQRPDPSKGGLSQNLRSSGERRRQGHPEGKRRSLITMADHFDPPAMCTENRFGD